MSYTKQQLTSAWLDNEAASLQAKEAEADQSQSVNSAELADILAPEQRETWQRYALIGNVMRGETASGQPVDLSARIAAKIAQEGQNEVVDVSMAAGGARSKAAMRWFKPAASVAVAASVAIVAVLSVQQFNQPGIDGAASESMEPALITNPIGGRNPVSFNTVGNGREQLGAPNNSAQASPDADAMQQQQRQVHSYLIDHQQQLQLRQQAQQQADEKPEEHQPPQ